MNRKALYDANGILRSHGYVDFVPGPGQTVREVAETFDLKPGQWRLQGNTHVPYQEPPSQAESRREDALTKLAAAANDAGIPLKVREALAAIRSVI